MMSSIRMQTVYSSHITAALYRECDSQYDEKNSGKQLTSLSYMHIICEVKAEVIRFSPCRLALAGLNSQKNSIVADTCVSAIFNTYYSPD